MPCLSIHAMTIYTRGLEHLSVKNTANICGNNILDLQAIQSSHWRRLLLLLPATIITITFFFLNKKEKKEDNSDFWLKKKKANSLTFCLATEAARNVIFTSVAHR